MVSNFVPCVVSVVDLVVKIVVSVDFVVVPLDVAVIVVGVVCVATLLSFVVISGTTAAVAPEEESSKSSKTELVLSPEIFSFSSFDFISNRANWGKSVAKTVDFERIISYFLVFSVLFSMSMPSFSNRPFASPSPATC